MRFAIVLTFALFDVVAGNAAEIGGIVRGGDSVHVVLLRPNEETPLASAAADADGNFSISTDQTGIVIARFTGSNHRGREVALDISRDSRMRLDISLAETPPRVTFAN